MNRHANDQLAIKHKIVLKQDRLPYTPSLPRILAPMSISQTVISQKLFNGCEVSLNNHQFACFEGIIFGLGKRKHKLKVKAEINFYPLGLCECARGDIICMAEHKPSLFNYFDITGINCFGIHVPCYSTEPHV